MTADPTSRSAAFDEASAARDASFGRNAVTLLFRHVVQRRLEALFRRGDRVLDLGCGNAEDALFLASRGVRVVGLDRSAAIVARARLEAARRGHGAECRFEVLDLEALSAAGEYDGAYSSSGALHRAHLPAVGAALAAALRPGAAVLLSLPGPWPLPGTVRRALTGLGEPRRGRARTDADPLAPTYPTLAQARRALGPAFAWTDAYALGVLLPGPEQGQWVAEHAHAFGMLAALERAVRRWPLLRQLGDHAVLEGRRVDRR